MGAIRSELAIQGGRSNHRAGRLLKTSRQRQVRQLGLESAMAINPTRLMMDSAELMAQKPIRRSLLPGMEAAAGYPQQPTHRCYGIATGQRFDDAELHFAGCEKMVSAYFALMVTSAMRWTLSTLSQSPFSPGQTTTDHSDTREKPDASPSFVVAPQSRARSAQCLLAWGRSSAPSRGCSVARLDRILGLQDLA